MAKKLTNAEKLAILTKEMDEKGLNVDASGFIGAGVGGKIGNIKGLSKSVRNKLSDFTKKKPGNIKGLSKEVSDRLSSFAKRPKQATITIDEITSIQKARQFGSSCNKEEFELLKNTARETIQKAARARNTFKKTGKNSHYLISEKLRKKEIFLRESVDEYKGSIGVAKDDIIDQIAKTWQKVYEKDRR